MLSYLFSEVICEKYRDIEEWHNKNQINTKGLLVGFKLGEANFPSCLDYGKSWDNSRYPKYQLLIWGEANYVGVFMRETALHPELKSDWFLLAHHDSCWRDDGVRTFINHAEDHICTFDGLRSWFQVLNMEEYEYTQELKDLIRERRDRKIHPLFERG